MSHYVRSTLIGSLAVPIWGTFALLVTLTENRIPPFQMLAMTFFIAFSVMMTQWLYQGHFGFVYLRQRKLAWMIGVGGLFGYHLFYFIAMANAPAVEASLLNYLWPLLIVLFSALLPGEHLAIKHVLGAMLALFGCWLLITGKGDGGKSGFEIQYLYGYIAALIAAVLWGGYSVSSRLVKEVPTGAVGWFCLATSILALLIHIIVEQTVWPEGWVQWLGVLGLGLGPVGISFFLWDRGIKHGNLQLLGVFAYAAPLISTVLLVVAGKSPYSHNLLLACLAITFGALIAGWKRRPKLNNL